MKAPDFEDLDGVQKSVLEFTSKFCRALAKKFKGNYFCSSLSAHELLSNVAYGAEQNTAAQMHKALYLRYPDFELLRDYRRIMNILNTDENVDKDDDRLNKALSEILEDEDLDEEQRTERMVKRRTWHEEEKLRYKRIECAATLANKIYICNDRTITVQQQFANATSMAFRDEIEIVNYLNRSESADIINNWCIETTNGKMSDVIDPGEFPYASALILVNVVHFTGTWSSQFETARPKAFHLNLFNIIQVPTMYIKRKMPYRYLGALNAHSLCLTFMRSEKYMEIIVPNRINGLRVIKKVLYKLNNEGFKSIDLRLWLPKFEIQTKIKLEDHLKKMGDAFDKRLANFNKICDKEVFIKTAVQRAYIKVDEIGCESPVARKAPSDTAPNVVYTRKKPLQVTVKANRPFLFRIMDSRLSVPLYIGTVVNPISRLT